MRLARALHVALAGATALAAATLAAAPLAAQTGRLPGAFELGVDAGVARDDEIDATVISVPVQRVRVGYFLSPTVSLEPAIGLNRVSGDGETITLFQGDLGVVAHLSGTTRTAGVYVRPFVGLEVASFDSDAFGDESDSRPRLGAGLGLKLPVLDGRLAWRLEGTFTRQFESGDRPGSNVIALLVGLSFLTR